MFQKTILKKKFFHPFFWVVKNFIPFGTLEHLCSTRRSIFNIVGQKLRYYYNNGKIVGKSKILWLRNNQEQKNLQKNMTSDDSSIPFPEIENSSLRK